MKNRPEWWFVGGVFVLMIVAFWARPDRSIQFANQLVKDDQLYEFQDDELFILEGYIAALLHDSEIEIKYAVNQTYNPNCLNIYIVESETSQKKVWSHGNASYVPSTDIIFLDAHYFRYGDNRIFGKNNDELTENVMAPLRFHAFFVLAHELGHRELPQPSWFNVFFDANANPSAEIAADAWALERLLSLYSKPNLRKEGIIPEPVSNFTGFWSDQLTPLQHIADHLGFSVNFIAGEYFDGPLPILSKSPTHPKFFSRLYNLLKTLQSYAKEYQDEDTLRILKFAFIHAESTYALINRAPTEIEFKYPFQYAFLDNENLIVIGNDEQPLIRLPLSSLLPNELVRLTNQTPKHSATVRYAWSVDNNYAMMLRRDSVLNLRHIDSGEVKQSWHVALGDSTCVKRFIHVFSSENSAYTTYCIENVDHLAKIYPTGEVLSVNLLNLVHQISHENSIIQEYSANVVGIDINSNNMVTLYAILGENTFSISLTQDLNVKSYKSIAFPVNLLPNAIEFKNSKLIPKVFFTNSDGGTSFLQGTTLFRELKLYEVQTSKQEIIASIDLTPNTDEHRLSTIVTLRDTFPISENSTVVNLTEHGVYMIDFEHSQISPLSRDSFTSLEQIVANNKGDWIVFRKYGNRILLFRENLHD